MRTLILTTLLAWACDEPGGGGPAKPPTCSVDFPCSFGGHVASCVTDPTRIIPFKDYEQPPCSGSSCGPGPMESCPDGTLCVEPRAYGGECRPVAETCGGPERRPCGADLVCVHRETAGFETTCLVGDHDLVGVCEVLDPTLEPCGFPLVCEPSATCDDGVARCSDQPDEVIETNAYACSDVCAEACEGTVCAEERSLCTHGWVCVEPVLGDALCRLAAEVCGGPQGRDCDLATERCIHRASGAHPPRECAVGVSIRYGFCEPVNDIHYEPCE